MRACGDSRCQRNSLRARLRFGLLVLLPFYDSTVADAASWSGASSYALTGLYKQARVREEWTNPSNQVYQLPESLWEASIRPDFKLQGDSGWSLVARPRLRYEREVRSTPTPAFAKEASDTDAFVSEAYLACEPHAAWQAVLGLQNYQWGPAELASPSNPLFRDLGLDKVAFYETRGLALARLNFTPHPQNSWVLLVEPSENGEERPAFAEEFNERIVLKGEYADATQTNYLGWVLAAGRGQGSSLGLYGNWEPELTPGFTIYADLMLQNSPLVWYPSADPFAANFTKGRPEQAGKTTERTLVAGLRYVTEGGSDLRVEAFHDSSAWTREERKNAFLTLAAHPEARTLSLFTKPGSLLPGRDFIYASLRIPEWGWRRKQTVSLRALRSSGDQSWSGLVNLDQQTSDHLTLTAGLQLNRGRTTGELSQGHWQLFYAGGSWNW